MKKIRILGMGAAVLFILMALAPIIPASLDHTGEIDDSDISSDEDVTPPTTNSSSLKNVTGKITSYKLNPRGCVVSFVVGGVTIHVSESTKGKMVDWRSFTDRIIHLYDKDETVKVTYKETKGKNIMESIEAIKYHGIN